MAARSSLTLPQQMAAADGVIDGFTFAGDLSSLTISRSIGADITVTIPAGLRAQPRTDGEINTLIDARRGNRLMLSTMTTYTEANDLLEGNAPFVPVLGDQITFVMPTSVADADGALQFRARSGDAALAFHDRDGNDLEAGDVQAGRLYSVTRFSAEYRILEAPDEGEAPVQDHTNRAAISPDTALSAAEVNAGTSSDDETTSRRRSGPASGTFSSACPRTRATSPTSRAAASASSARGSASRA